MRIAITGATGFLGRYIVNLLLERAHNCCCWYRPDSDRSGFEDAGERLELVPGERGDAGAACTLVRGCGAVVHAALHQPSGRFSGGRANESDCREEYDDQPHGHR